MKINVVTGYPCIGKSTYIAENKEFDDIVIDFFKYQQDIEKSGTLQEVLTRAYYEMLADIELAICKNIDSDKTIWVEYTFLKSFRRKMFLNYFKVFSEAQKKPFEINLIWIKCTEERYVQNYLKRYFDISKEKVIEQAYVDYNIHNVAINNVNHDRSYGWDNIIIYKYK